MRILISQVKVKLAILPTRKTEVKDIQIWMRLRNFLAKLRISVGSLFRGFFGNLSHKKPLLLRRNSSPFFRISASTLPVLKLIDLSVWHSQPMGSVASMRLWEL